MRTAHGIDEPRRGRTESPGDETKEQGRPMLGDKSRLTSRAQPLIHARGMRCGAARPQGYSSVRPFDRPSPRFDGYHRDREREVSVVPWGMDHTEARTFAPLLFLVPRVLRSFRWENLSTTFVHSTMTYSCEDGRERNNVDCVHAKLLHFRMTSHYVDEREDQSCVLRRLLLLRRTDCRSILDFAIFLLDFSK